MDEPAKFELLRAQVFASYTAGDHPHTLRLALESLERFPGHRAEATFWAACMHSLMGDPEAAVHLRHDALEDGMWWAATLFRDSDLDAARQAAGFAALSTESERR